MRRFATFLAMLAAISLGCADANACCWCSPCSYPCPAPVYCVYPRAASAWLYITVPDGAKLFFGDTATAQTSGTWAWWTPPLLFGYEYAYELKVKPKDGGNERTEVRVFRAGTVTHVDFTKNAKEEKPKPGSDGSDDATKQAPKPPGPRRPPAGAQTQKAPESPQPQPNGGAKAGNTKAVPEE